MSEHEKGGCRILDVWEQDGLTPPGTHWWAEAEIPLEVGGVRVIAEGNTPEEARINTIRQAAIAAARKCGLPDQTSPCDFWLGWAFGFAVASVMVGLFLISRSL